MKKKFLSIFLAVCMVLTMVPTAAWADSLTTAAQYAAASPAAASGTDYESDTGSKTLVIKTAKGAAWWSANGNSYLGYTIKLANDIDVSAFLWTPVGDSSNSFYGIFNGQGHTIKGLTILRNGMSRDYAGLFGRVDNATIKNVGLIDSSVTMTNANGGYYNNAGGIVGGANGGAITNCYTIGSVAISGRGSLARAGGIAGYVNGTAITNCYHTGNVAAATTDPSSSTIYTGGIVAGAMGGTFSNCYYLTGAGMPDKGINATYSTNPAVTGCGTFADNSNTLTAGTASNFPSAQTLTYTGTLLNALNGWVNNKANTGYYTWKADDTTTPINDGYPVLDKAWAPTALTGTVTISGTLKYGETLTAAYASGNNTGTLSYQWKRGSTAIGTNSNTYTVVKDDIDQTLTCEVRSSVQAGPVTSGATAKIAKADGAAVSGVSAAGCTTAGNNDGKLTGVTAAMEYKKSGDAIYITGTGSDITGLASGDYLVRVKETDTNNAGADSTFTVDALPAVSKTLVSITAPASITGITNGTEKSAAALGLPGTVVMVTDNGNVDADINWDVTGCSYDKSKTTEQTFTVNGTAVLPTGVVNPNNVPLTITINVTVKAAAGGDTTPKTITGFLMDYTTKTVPYGTGFASLNLPDKIKAVGDELGGIWVRVTEWLHSTYQSNVAGTYTLTAVLDSGYVGSGYVDSGFELGSGVKAPEIKVTVQERSSGSKNSGSNSTSSSASTVTDKTETKVDPTGNTATVTTKPDSVSTDGNTARIETTVSSITVDNTSTSTNGSTVDTTKKSAVTINLPTEAIVQQLTAKKDVDLTVTVPSEVAKDAVGGAAVTINANKEILEAAKANLTDVTVKIKDAATQQFAYSWTFKGEDLAKSTVPVKDVNIAMSVHLTTEVPKVNSVTSTNKGLVLSFDHSGLLPSVASVKFSALEKGFKPWQTLYFYYYNPATKQIESLGKDAYTVDADGNVAVQIYHCSDYVLLTKAVRTITLDTRTYTMPPKKSYEIGVKLTGVSNTTIKAYSSTRGAANVTVLKNGNVKATAVKLGLTYIMIDVYDSKNKFLTHASIRITVQNGVKENGNSARQFGIF